MLGWAAFIMALLLTLGAPVGYFLLSYRAEARESKIAARLHAAFITQVIVQAEGDWRRDVVGLLDTDLAPGTSPEQRLLRDLKELVISRSGPSVDRPWLSTREPVSGRDGPVAVVESVRSLRPMLLNTAIVAGFGLALGGATFMALGALRRRALANALDHLSRQEALARAGVEESLRIVFEHAVEGILALSSRGRILSINPAAAQIWDSTPQAMTGRLLPELLRRADDARLTLDAGRFEAVALRSPGTHRTVEVAINEMSVGGEGRRIMLLRDITERKTHEARMTHLAHYDPLTGLPNRTLFRTRLELAMARARRSGRSLALMFLDLDRFKHINDSLGHDVGDQLLQQVAERLAHSLRETDLLVPAQASAATGGDVSADVYRLGGDEFTVLVEDLPDAEAAAGVARRIVQALAQPIAVAGRMLFTSASVGITMYPDDDNSLDGLIRQADVAMYHSKDVERGSIHFFDPEIGARAVVRHELETQLRQAVLDQAFALYYQPKADLASGRITGVEVLLRWPRPDLPAVGPDVFVPILEDIGLIVEVGDWVLTQACRQMVAWQHDGLPTISLAVNLSPRQFRQPGLVERVAAVLAQTGLDPHRLELEVTERMLVADDERALQLMRELSATGVRIAIDDFGTGHSSLSYLKHFEVHTLKIDRSFVRDTPGDSQDSAIASAIITLGHGLNLLVVAEGVETTDQQAFLRDLGCDEMQGYLLSRPLAPQAFATWFDAYARAGRHGRALAA